MLRLVSPDYIPDSEAHDRIALELACGECGRIAHYLIDGFRFDALPHEHLRECDETTLERNEAARAELRSVLRLARPFQCRFCKANADWELTRAACMQLLGHLLQPA